MPITNSFCSSIYSFFYHIQTSNNQGVHTIDGYDVLRIFCQQTKSIMNIYSFSIVSCIAKIDSKIDLFAGNPD